MNAPPPLVLRVMKFDNAQVEIVISPAMTVLDLKIQLEKMQIAVRLL